MMPALEWSFILNVGKILVPFELCDTRSPSLSQWKPRSNSEGCDDNRTHARGFLRFHPSLRERRHSIQSDYLRPACCRHDPRQILRIREEREGPLKREGNPLLKFQMDWHARPQS